MVMAVMITAKTFDSIWLQSHCQIFGSQTCRKTLPLLSPYCDIHGQLSAVLKAALLGSGNFFINLN
jgi:hypothetical protein